MLRISPAGENYFSNIRKLKNSTANNAKDANNGVPVPELPDPDQPEIPVVISKEQRVKQREHAFILLQHIVQNLQATVSFGLAVTATVLSGGAGLPIMLTSGAALLISVGDSCCAFYNYRQVRQGQDTLRTNNDCIALLTSKLTHYCGLNLSRSENMGDGISLLLRSGISMSSTLLPQLIPIYVAGGLSDKLSMDSAIATTWLTFIGEYLNVRVAKNQRDLLPEQRKVETPPLAQEEEEAPPLAQQITEACQHIIDSPSSQPC